MNKTIATGNIIVIIDIAINNPYYITNLAKKLVKFRIKFYAFFTVPIVTIYKNSPILNMIQITVNTTITGR